MSIPWIIVWAAVLLGSIIVRQLNVVWYVRRLKEEGYNPERMTVFEPSKEMVRRFSGVHRYSNLMSCLGVMELIFTVYPNVPAGYHFLFPVAALIDAVIFISVPSSYANGAENFLSTSNLNKARRWQNYALLNMGLFWVCTMVVWTMSIPTRKTPALDPHLLIVAILQSVLGAGLVTIQILRHRKLKRLDSREKARLAADIQ